MTPSRHDLCCHASHRQRCVCVCVCVYFVYNLCLMLPSGGICFFTSETTVGIGLQQIVYIYFLFFAHPFYYLDVSGPLDELADPP